MVNHLCTEKKRANIMNTPVGLRALEFYSVWMHTRKYTAHTAAFTTSKYFDSMVRFVEFANKVRLPYPEKFIWLMVQKNYEPTMWCDDQIYVEFLEFVDYKLPPMEHVTKTISTLLKLSEAYDVDISQVFQHMRPTELLHLVRLRSVSPWVLLNCKTFNKFFQTFTPEQRIIAESLINPNYWFDRFDKEPSTVAKIKQYLDELNI